MAAPKVPPRLVDRLAAALDSPEVGRLIADLSETRRTGRPGYPLRAMVGMTLIRGLYRTGTWSRTAALVAEHEGLQRVLGCAPSVYACYRFCEKLRAHEEKLERCVGELLAGIRRSRPELGDDLAVDGSDLPAYANGQRYVSKGGRERAPEEYSDPDASWGHRSAVSTRKGGGYYGYKLHMVVCTSTELPVAWRVETARHSEITFAPHLVKQARGLGLKANTCALDKGYDASSVYEGLEELGCSPVIPLRRTTGVKRGDHLAEYDGPPTRLHPSVGRDTERWRTLYKRRGAIERAFGRLKHEWGLTSLRARGLSRVRLHVNLVLFASIACAATASPGT